MSIVNAKLNERSALQVIEQSHLDFYLGGSRRMAQIAQSRVSNINIVIQPNTDYDFYATYSESVVAFLRTNGFKPTEHYYKCLRGDGSYEFDSEVVSIWEREYVQVVLRKDAEFYYTVFENIPTDFYYYFLWKSSPACPDRSRIQPIFEALFAVARAVAKDQRYRIISY